MKKGTYRSTSEQSGACSESIAKTFLIKLGYIVADAPRDCIFDYVVARNFNEKTKKWSYWNIQVKTLSGNRLTKTVDRAGEVVSKGGKQRKSVDYAEYGIDWLLGVSKEGKIHCYPLDMYGALVQKTFSVRKYPSYEFPEYGAKISSNNKNRKIK